MNPDDNNQANVEAPTGDDNNGETPVAAAQDAISVSKAEYDKMLSDLGSLKRENKDLKKPKPDAPAAPPPDATNALLEKTFLRAASITAEDEVELARETAKKWDMPIDKLVDDEDFKEKLEKHRTKKSNEAATSNLKGNGTAKSASQTPEYWIAKGTPPTADQVPDRKTRATIARAMMANTKNGNKFYNDGN